MGLWRKFRWAVLLTAGVGVGAAELLFGPFALRMNAPLTRLPIAEQSLSHGRFAQVHVFIPHGSPRGFVLLLSGAEGWSASMASAARQIAAEGAMVAGIDLAQFDAVLEADGGGCVFPDGDLENLSHFVQAYFRLPTYLTPILAGSAAGGTLAYAVLAQAPEHTFAGAVSLGFCPTYPLKKPLCRGAGIDGTPVAGGVEFRPDSALAARWIVLNGTSDKSCDEEEVRRFVAQVPHAQWTVEPKGAGNPQSAPWPARYADTFRGLIADNAPAPDQIPPPALAALPIVFVPAVPGSPRTDDLAIMVSGDGGWAGLDKEVAGALAADGIPVIGLDSLRYFWSSRTPDGMASDLERMISFYVANLHKQRVLLIGYSQGADVLPFALNRLTATARGHVVLLAIMGMSEHALFEFHLSSWVADDDSGPPTLPEVDRVTGVTVLCIYGADETDSLCPKLDPTKTTIVRLKGGHHFDGNYAGLAAAILAAAGH